MLAEEEGLNKCLEYSNLLLLVDADIKFKHLIVS